MVSRRASAAECAGIKTPVGIKLQGANLEQIQQLGAQVQQILSGLPQIRSVFAERVSQGFYINVEVNRPEAAKYGLTIADVQQAVESGIGGMNVAENVEGRGRYPINVRYQRDFRDNVGELSRVLIATPSGAQIPISEVAKISFSRGPAMIRDEDGQLTGYVYVDLNTTDYGGFVDQATKLLRQKLQLPAGYTYQWSGEYEFQLRAKERMKIILPVVFFVIFLLLYMVFHNVTEAMVLIFPTFYAMTGGLILQWLLGYNFSVAVWVGYIALFGIAVETGVVMVVYLHEALGRRIVSGRPLTDTDIQEAAIEGAVHRLRPKLMTVCAVLASLIPILWASGIGSDVMKPIAAPMVGGMITSTIHVLILVPVFFVLMKERALRHGTLRPNRRSNKEGPTEGQAMAFPSESLPDVRTMSNAKLPIYGLLICSGDGDRTRSASCDSTRKAVGIFHDRVEQLRGTGRSRRRRTRRQHLSCGIRYRQFHRGHVRRSAALENFN
jgi:copper/silver efflux system protein